MRFSIAAALALIAASSLHAQTPITDFSTATPIAGNWNFTASATGSEASFLNPSALPQLTIRCTKATRRVAIAKPATAAAASITVWTSSSARPVPASFNPLTQRITIDLVSNDPLLDALAFSRGRVGITVAGSPSLVVPAAPEIARVVEDCRA